MVKNPLLLHPDNFTPLARTPWAGYEIARKYKNQLLAGVENLPVGESWEFSCDPDFPSKVVGSSESLPELVAKQREAILSPRLAAQGHKTCEILVKLINPKEPLSLQIHPRDDDTHLKAHECGKPESWLVLEADPGSGLYLGFSQPITKDRLRELLLRGAECEQYLQFVPVKRGDYFEIDPGVPHAIGPGVVLLEPQRILSGKSGKTYRMWDWGRRYNTRGELDVHNGKPRELHVEEALRLVRPEVQVGEEFAATTRRSATTIILADGVALSAYPANAYYQLLTLEMAKGRSVRVEVEDGYAAWITLEGQLNLRGQGKKDVLFSKGQPGMIPHAAFPLNVDAREPSFVALLLPQGSRWNVRLIA